MNLLPSRLEDFRQALGIEIITLTVLAELGHNNVCKLSNSCVYAEW